MKANELRIGNWYNWYADGKNYQYQVKAEDFVNEIIENFDPIPLTEEILLKCGFFKCEDFDEGGLIDYRYELHLFNGSISFTSNWNTEDCIYVNLNQCGADVFYLHQLQNLYFALTGEELNVKL